MIKTYTFNNTQFTLRENNLSLLNSANEMLIKYRKKLFEYTSDLDMREADKYRKMIEEYRLSIEFIEMRIEEALAAGDELTAAEEKLELARIKSVLEELETEFNDNITVQNLINLESDCRDFVLLAIITDKELMKKTLKAILKGDFSNLDFDSPDIFPFIRDVILDFFLIMGKSKMKSAG